MNEITCSIIGTRISSNEAWFWTASLTYLCRNQRDWSRESVEPVQCITVYWKWNKWRGIQFASEMREEPSEAPWRWSGERPETASWSFFGRAASKVAITLPTVIETMDWGAESDFHRSSSPSSSSIGIPSRTEQTAEMENEDRTIEGTFGKLT